MLRESYRRLIGPRRRSLFWAWVGLTVLVAVAVGVYAPVAEYFGAGMRPVAIIIPPLMIVLLSAGLAWLVWLVSAPRRDHRERR
jgi:hypothetical protein